MQITVLGTSCMMPTKERNPSAVFLKFKGEGILFDCGEGTQRQMKIANLSLADVTRICISHWHGDHVLGLPGLLLTIASLNLNRAIDIYGPKGSKRSFQRMFGGIEFETKFNIRIHEVEKGIILDKDDFFIECLQMEHRVPCVGFAFQEKDRRRIKVSMVRKLGIPDGPLLGKLQRGESVTVDGKTVTSDEATTIVEGKRIAIITDTVLTENCIKLAENADVLICDSTYASKLKDKAMEHGHLTALEAGQIASRAGAKKLVLTHFSARYKDTTELEEDARTAFDNVVSAYDLMKIKV